MTRTRPYNLTPKDLEGYDRELVERRHAYVADYCTRKGWPTDPARLTSAQLFEILESEEWPR